MLCVYDMALDQEGYHQSAFVKKNVTVEDALSCPFGGFPYMRHNEIRDITAKFMSKLCHNVGVEPPLQFLSGVVMSYKTTNVEDGAHLNIKA